jgi:hypothetical protein
MIRRSEIMKNANVESKKILKADQPRRVAGVPVRSGVKAGRVGFEAGGKPGFEPETIGRPGGIF